MQLTSILPPRPSPETAGSLFLRPQPTEIDTRHESGALSLVLKPKRPTICAFQPLPSIVASPVCTPTSSIDNDEGYFSAFVPPDSSRVLFPTCTPTWIATPPTPTSKSIRRSNTSSTRRYPLAPVAPSASFPASMHTHAALSMQKGVRRAVSVPAFSFQHLEQTDSFASLMAAHFACDSVEDNLFNATFSIPGPLLTRCREHAGSYVKPAVLTRSDDSGSLENDDTEGYDKVENSPQDSAHASWSDHSIEDAREIERSKDAFRKFHALKELLATEVGYLMDLKALITVMSFAPIVVIIV